MGIHYSAKVDGDVLVVTATGFDESADEVRQYGLWVIGEGKRTGVARILCDERELEYRLSTLDTYATAAFIAAEAPRLARVAIVCSPRSMDDARFFENVAVNRGLTVRAFEDIAEARAWVAPVKVISG